MNLTWTCAILSLLVFATGLPEDELKGFISLTKYSYEDSCSKSARSEWNFVNEPTEKTRRSWESSTSEYALDKIRQMNETANQRIKALNDSALAYAYSVVIRPGDALLETGDFDRLVSFIGQVELSRLTGYYLTGAEKHYRQDVERQLARNGNPKDKLSAWSAWHRTLSPMANNFSHSLQLIEKAAIANGKNDIREYWEMLSGYENGYEHAKEEWNKISSIYNKILDFVKYRLSRKYGDRVENDTLPAHLLGSLRGYDWTNLAMDVIPYNDVTYGIRKNLWEKGMIGENLYKCASKLGNILLKHVPQADFWKESNFRGQCPSHLINLCKDGEMRISTCSEASIANFISAHKNVAEILVTQISHEAEPILNVANRYSALEEGIVELFGVLSVSQAWLSSRGLIDNSTDIDEIRIVSLMITALDVLPRIAYYLAADTWRIDATENTFDDNNLTSGWWKYRMEYQGVSTNVPDLPTFLDDDYITSNRPYLSKFLGTILGFQIYEYVMESTEVRYETITSVSGSHNLAKMMREGFADKWPRAMKKYLDFDEVNADALLSYFSSLIDYIDEERELNDDFSLPEKRENDLDILGDEYRDKFNEPSTTMSTSSTSSSGTTSVPIVSKNFEDTSTRKKEKAESSKSWKSEKNLMNSTWTKDMKISLGNETTDVTIRTEIVQPKSTGSSDERRKASTSKAVWAVGAVLVATVTICIIAIFGRRRCRKAPKNRRYV